VSSNFSGIVNQRQDTGKINARILAKFTTTLRGS
jgi:hypothetical protein